MSHPLRTVKGIAVPPIPDPPAVSTVQLPPIRTDFPDPIPGVIDFGTVNILAGAPGAGKTTLIAEWEGRWRDGKTICSCPTNKPTGVFYLSADRGGVSTRKLFDRHHLLADDYCIYYNPLDDPAFDRRIIKAAPRAIEALHYCLDRFPVPVRPGSHLIIDPAAPLFVPGNPNEPRPVACLLWELHILARKWGCTIFILAHFAKQMADAAQRYLRPQDRISGSVAWSGFSDTQMYLCDPEPPAHPYHQFGWTPRHAAPQEYKLLRNTTGFTRYVSLEDVGNAAQTKVSQTSHQILLLIPDEGIDTENLQAAAQTFCGISRATFFRHMKKLENLGLVERTHGFVKRVNLTDVVVVPDGESEDKPN